jgi:hypothetical protein
MKPKPLTELQATIVQVIAGHRGYDQRIGRVELCRQLSKSMGRPVRDREMRIAIEILRTNHPVGAYICATTRGGYWYAQTIEELNASLSQDERRAKKMLARLRRQRLRARSLTNQALTGTEAV